MLIDFYVRSCNLWITVTKNLHLCWICNYSNISALVVYQLPVRSSNIGWRETQGDKSTNSQPCSVYPTYRLYSSQPCSVYPTYRQYSSQPCSVYPTYRLYSSQPCSVYPTYRQYSSQPCSVYPTYRQYSSQPCSVYPTYRQYSSQPCSVYPTYRLCKCYAKTSSSAVQKRHSTAPSFYSISWITPYLQGRRYRTRNKSFKRQISKEIRIKIKPKITSEKFSKIFIQNFWQILLCENVIVYIFRAFQI